MDMVGKPGAAIHSVLRHLNPFPRRLACFALTDRHRHGRVPSQPCQENDCAREAGL